MQNKKPQQRADGVGGRVPFAAGNLSDKQFNRSLRYQNTDYLYRGINGF